MILSSSSWKYFCLNEKYANITSFIREELTEHFLDTSKYLATSNFWTHLKAVSFTRTSKCPKDSDTRKKLSRCRKIGQGKSQVTFSFFNAPINLLQCSIARNKLVLLKIYCLPLWIGVIIPLRRLNKLHGASPLNCSIFVGNNFR